MINSLLTFNRQDSGYFLWLLIFFGFKPNTLIVCFVMCMFIHSHESNIITSLCKLHPFGYVNITASQKLRIMLHKYIHIHTYIHVCIHWYQIFALHVCMYVCECSCLGFFLYDFLYLCLFKCSNVYWQHDKKTFVFLRRY